MKTKIFQSILYRQNFYNIVILFLFVYAMVIINCNLRDDYGLSNKTGLSKILPFYQAPSEPYNLSLLDENDKSTLIDLSDFRFLINNYPCHKSSVIDQPKEDTFLLIFIHSAPRNFEKRKIIRETWISQHNVSSLQIRSIFLLGKVSDTQLQNQIDQENNLHADIIQGNFYDSYRNLTYKHIMGLKWITYYCQSAKFIFKTDDDIFVDIFQLVNYLKTSHLNSLPPRKFMSCFVIRNPYVKRSGQSKWHVTFKEYPDKYYPQYCFGWGVIMSPDVVFNLYRQSKSTPYFWVDDVYVTGLLAQKIGLDQIDLDSRLALNDDEIQRWLDDKESLSLPPLFGRPDFIKDSRTIYDLWNKTIQYYQVKYCLM